MGPQVFQTRPCANASSEKSSSTSQRRPYTRPGTGAASGSAAAAASRLLQAAPGAGPSPGPSSGCRSSSLLQLEPMTTRGPRGPCPALSRWPSTSPALTAGTAETEPRKPDGLMLLPQGQEEWKRSGSSPGVQGWYERLQGKRTVTLHCPQLQKSRPPKTPIPLGGGKRHEGKEKRDYKTRRRRNKGKKRLHWKNPKLRVNVSNLLLQRKQKKL